MVKESTAKGRTRNEGMKRRMKRQVEKEEKKSNNDKKKRKIMSKRRKFDDLDKCHSYMYDIWLHPIVIA